VGAVESGPTSSPFISVHTCLDADSVLTVAIPICSGHASPALSADEAGVYTGPRQHRAVAELLPDMPKVRAAPQTALLLSQWCCSATVHTEYPCHMWAQCLSSTPLRPKAIHVMGTSHRWNCRTL